MILRFESAAEIRRSDNRSFRSPSVYYTGGKNFLMQRENRFRPAALVTGVIGAIGSVAFTLYAGRHNESRFLILLFVGWVLSPFVALVVAQRIRKNWPERVRASIEILTLLVTVVSLGAYATVTWGPPRPKPAAVFLLVPALCWFLIGFVVLRAARRSHTRSGANS